MEVTRCGRAGTDPLYVSYPDKEWGGGDERKLFEFLTLEGMQAELSWITILRKHKDFRKAFDNFEPGTIARYGEKDISRLLAAAGIIRNWAKINAAIGNARTFLKVQEEFGSFDTFIWPFVNIKPIQNNGNH